MESPKVAAKFPAAVVLEPGAYFWCACGKSKNQPFCDGSHQGSGIFPVQFKIDNKREVFCASASKRKTNHFAMALTEVCKNQRGKNFSFYPFDF